MTDDTRYNGWTNYETWNVKLWLDNDEGSYHYWQERAEYWNEHESTSTHWTQEQSARFNLADELEQEVKDAAPEMGAGMYADLLGAALSEVDWHEIAGAMLDDLVEA